MCYLVGNRKCNHQKPFKQSYLGSNLFIRGLYLDPTDLISNFLGFVSTRSYYQYFFLVSLFTLLCFQVFSSRYLTSLRFFRPTSPMFTFSSFYSLLLVELLSLLPHLTRFPTSIRISRNPYNFKGFSWNLF